MGINVLNELTDEVLRLTETLKQRRERLDAKLSEEDPETVTDDELAEKYGDEFERIRKMEFVLLKKEDMLRQAQIDYQSSYYKEMNLIRKPVKITSKYDIEKMSRGDLRRLRFENREDFRTRWNNLQLSYFL